MIDVRYDTKVANIHVTNKLLKNKNLTLMEDLFVIVVFGHTKAIFLIKD
jgi:hypothetical protein